jgi:hypothetical protein
MTWPVLSEATFDIRELETHRGSRGEEEKGLKVKKKCFMKQFTILPVASHSVISMRRVLCWCVCRVVLYSQVN